VSVVIPKDKILAIVPAFNEEGKVGQAVSGVNPYVGAVLVVDDGSTDNTRTEALEAGAVVLSHTSNMGVGAAIRTGITYAIKNGYEVVVITGGDFQNDPTEIPYLLEKIDEGYEWVQGSRYLLRPKEPYPVFRKITTKLYTFVFRLVSGANVTDASNGFAAFRIGVVKGLDLRSPCLDRYELQPYLLLEAAMKHKYVEVPVKKIYPKGKSYSKMRPLKDWISILRPLVWRVLRRLPQ